MKPKMTPEEKAAKKKKSDFIAFVKNTLRKASYRWKPRGEVEREARVERGKYRCAQCGEILPRKSVQLDHIEPVIPIKEDWHLPDGSPDWNIYIKRLFCEKEGFAVLCLTCHESKTQTEDSMRAFYNAKRKENT